MLREFHQNWSSGYKSGNIDTIFNCIYNAISHMLDMSNMMVPKDPFLDDDQCEISQAMRWTLGACAVSISSKLVERLQKRKHRHNLELHYTAISLMLDMSNMMVPKKPFLAVDQCEISWARRWTLGPCAV